MKLLRLFSSKKTLDDHLTKGALEINEGLANLKTAAIKGVGLGNTKLGKYLTKEAEIGRATRERELKSASKYRQAVFLKNKRKKGSTMLDAIIDRQTEMNSNSARSAIESYKNLAGK